MAAPLPADEAARLRAMWRYTRHDRSVDPALEAIVQLAVDAFDMRIALISLVDESCQWFKSQVGLGLDETPREFSFCAHAILGEGPFEVVDAAQDPRFHANPLVTGPPHIRYYLGTPLVTPEGFAIGTLCLIDSRPRTLDKAQKAHLRGLGEQVMRHFELQRLRRLEETVTRAGLGTWELDVASDAVWGNMEFQRLHGSGPLTLGSRQALSQDYLPEDRERLQAGLEAVIREGAPFEACLRLKRPGEAQTTWVQLTAARADAASPSRHLAGTLQDITSLKQNKRELEWRHRIDQLVTRLQSGFIAGDDIPGTFATALEALLEFTESEYGFIGEVFHDAEGLPYLQTYAITDISWDEASQALFQQARAQGLRFTRLDTLFGHVLQSAEPLISNAPGSDPRSGGLPPGHPPLKALLCLPVLLEGEMVAMVGLANRPDGYSERSLTLLEPLLTPLAQLVHSLRLRRQHDAAWQRLELSAKVFASSREAIMISDAENRIIEVNEAFERITGYSRDEVLGKNPGLLSSGRQTPAFYQALWQTLREEGHWQGEMLNRRKNGELLPEMLSISVVRNDAGEATHHVAVFSDLTRLKQHADELFRAGHFDRLTGMPNRHHMVQLMQEALGRRRPEESLAVGVLDLDRFQDLNARLGREESDRVLVALAGRLAEAVAPGDLVARLGGDEFAFLLHRFQDAGERLERIIERLAEPLPVRTGEVLRVTGSLGVTLYPADDADPETLLRHADQAMYRAKVLGGNSYVLFDPDREQQIKALQARRKALSRALLNDEFVLYYQPQIDPRTRRAIGVEALIRWQHPEQGLLAPHAFLPTIAGSDLELAFDAWVLRTALRQVEAWLAEGLSLGVCINLTPKSLTQDGFVDTLRATLAAHPRVPPKLLCLEVLESTALDDFQAATRVMRDCRALGVQVALDDFGTGYSSLAYLRNLPVDVIKVDRSFVMSMLEREHDLAIVESVIYLAKRFGKQVVAEGVESAAHSERLQAMGCDLLQGFGIARPMPGEALPAWCQAFADGRQNVT
ncbi:EAL domain-containing protein [Halomonas sp. A11-A]|uniref:bifunctional diguanylate cyclase/phosphodiesterase n=1 Tax=Halomonas sp. A11-A TaxID=2183985 RepID=UPI000D7140C4|nr:EAL domain-containing protein [Halomonas sp. A11-A]PWV70279.1 PAS domain S-box-containing protein/diguanylate cyclase (GGDEF)-like protein [Halomonas sp. A11-A]